MTIDINHLQKELGPKSAPEVIAWAVKTYGQKLTFANSFGAEDVVLTALIAQANPKASIFTLDTGRLPQETYAVWAALEQKYGIRIQPYFPERSAVESMVQEKGINLFYESVENRKLCCHIRKVEPLQRALKGKDAWITGLRREQAVTRTDIHKIEKDTGNQLMKLNPLADWTEKQVWDYIKQNKVPYNQLHDQGYRSIGCAPCTRAVKPDEDVRAGRWWWENPEHKECGLHIRKNDRNTKNKTQDIKN